MISCGFTRPRRLDSLSALRLAGLAVSGLAALVLPLTSGLRSESANLVDTDRDERPRWQWDEDASGGYAYSHDRSPYWLGFWFREGQAVYMCGAGEKIMVTTLAESLQWWLDETHINPVFMRRFVDYSNPDSPGECCRMCGLAYACLVDGEDGPGETIENMRDLLRYVNDGDSFEEAFDKALGISVSWYRDNL